MIAGAKLMGPPPLVPFLPLLIRCAHRLQLLLTCARELIEFCYKTKEEEKITLFFAKVDINFSS